MTTTERLVHDIRPSTEAFDAAWSAETLAAIMAQPSAGGAPSRRPRRVASLAAAAAVLGVVAVPTVLSSGGASARADLLRLATVAARSDGPVIRPGTYLHVKTESLQENSRLVNDGRRLDTDRESWVRWDGAMWAVDTRPSAGWTEYHRFPTPTEVSFGTPTPEFIAALPDTAPGLRAYLDARVSGSNSHDEALYAAVSDLVGSRMLDADMFSVALEVLAGIDGVQTRETEVDGRRAVEVWFDRIVGGGRISRDSFTVDRATAQLLRVAQTSAASSYESHTTVVDVVDEVPADVLAKYRQLGNGVRVCADGSEARDTADPKDNCR